jgi:RNA-directed DNA polymerase
MAEAGLEMVRYADDFVILCRSAEDAARALGLVQHWTAEAGLTLHPTKTRVLDARTEPFDFLGYRFEDGTRRPRPKSLEKFRGTIRAKTARNSGGSLKTIIASLNPIRHSAAGSSTSSRVTSGRSSGSTAGSGCACGASSAGG